MDILDCDPDLSQEIVLMLYHKLQQRRHELEDLRQQKSASEVVLVDSTTIQRENESLKAELLKLQLRSAVVDNRDSDEDMKPAIITPSDEDYSDGLDAQAATVADIMREHRQEEDAHAEVVRSMQERLAGYKSKYNASKVETTELSKTLADMLTQLQSKTENLVGYKEYASTIKSNIEATRKQRKEPFDMRVFASGARVNANVKFPRMNTLKTFCSSAPFSGLPSVLLKRFGTLRLLVLRPTEVIWFKSSSIERGIYLHPSHTYDPTSLGGYGGWEEYSMTREIREDDNQEREVICRRKNDWYYYGTYKCTYSDSVATDELEAIPGGSQMSTKTEPLEVLRKDQLAPVVLTFLRELHQTGPMSLRGTALERIGFNQCLYDELLSHKKAVQRGGHRHSKSSARGGGSLSRKRGGGGPRKKHKKM